MEWGIVGVNKTKVLCCIISTIFKSNIAPEEFPSMAAGEYVIE